MYVPLIKLHMVKEKELPYAKEIIDNPQKVAKLARIILEGADKEHLLVISVDAKIKPVGIEIVSIGSVDSAIVQAREVFKHSILTNAVGIILTHNHPSGDVTPSKEDCRITKRVRDAGELLGIPVLDHIILGDEDVYLSMKEEYYW